MTRQCRLLFLVIVQAAPWAWADEATLQQICTTWKSRATSVSSGYVQWKTRVLKDSVACDDAHGLQTTESYLFGSGTRRRYEVRGTTAGPSGRLTLDDVRTDNGNGVWKSLGEAHENIRFRHGSIEARSWGRREIYPLLLFFGRLPDLYALEADSLRIVDANHPLPDDLPGILIEETHSPRSNLRRLIVEATPPYVIRQMSVVSRAGVLESRIDMEYSRETGEPVLGGWTYFRFSGDQKLTAHESSTVLRVETNISVDDTQFDLTFPPGTVVQDERTNQTFVALNADRFRLVTDAEREAGIPIETLMKTRPRDLRADPINESDIPWVGLVNLSVLAVAAAAYASNRAGRTNDASSPSGAEGNAAR